MVHLLRYIRDNKNLGLKYYANINDASVSDLLRQASNKTENHLMAFYDSNWKYFPETGRSTGACIIFYQGGPIDHVTYVPGQVYQSSVKNDYNAACTARMALANFRMLINELLNKDTDIVSKETPLIILDSKSDMCMEKNGKYTKHTRHIAKIMNLVRNVEKCKMHNIDWCEGGLQLKDIATNNVGDHYLTPRMKYIMVRLDN